MNQDESDGLVAFRAAMAAAASVRESAAARPRASGTGRGRGDGIPVWGDNEMRIRNIQSWLGPNAPQLWQEGRVLVGEGVLAKQCRKGNKPRQFYLFNDMIVYATIIAMRRQYAAVRVLMLHEVEVASDADPKCLIIRHPVRSFRVYAATAEETNDWITHIQMCIKALPPSTEQTCRPFAALWVPDSESTVCMACGVQRFSIFARRHHCRKCGILVCSKCSSYKAMLPRHVFSGPPQTALQRVCHTCHQQLTATAQPETQADAPPKPAAASTAPTVIVRQVIDESSSEEETPVTLRPAAGQPLFRDNVRSSIFFFDDELDDGRKASTLS